MSTAYDPIARPTYTGLEPDERLDRTSAAAIDETPVFGTPIYARRTTKKRSGPSPTVIGLGVATVAVLAAGAYFVMQPRDQLMAEQSVTAPPAAAPPVTEIAAQTTTPPPYGPPIALEAAKKVVSAAEAEAARNNWQVAIAVIDSGGHLVMMLKLDNTQLVSIRVAEAKAKSALGFRLPTKLLEDAVAQPQDGTNHAAPSACARRRTRVPT